MADRARGWPIAREGLPFLALAGVPAVAAWALGWTAAGSLFGAVVLFTGWFFRNPPRRVPDVANLVVTPCAGLVKAVTYSPGRFLVASRPDATLANEQVAALFETDAGHRVLCVQVAGYVARRIVCWLTEGERVARGERYGLIRFGSRMDLYLPKETEMRIKTGDKVTGGESIIGVLP